MPLTEEGHDEAKKAAGAVSQYPVGSIRHSDMQRASQAAQHIEHATGPKSQADKSLDPWDVGFFPVTRANMLNEESSTTLSTQAKMPEGEAYGDWHSKYEDGLTCEIKKAAQQPDKARVVVSHSCNAMAKKSIVRGEDPQFYGEGGEKPGHVVKLEKRGGQWKMSDVDMAGAVSR